MMRLARLSLEPSAPILKNGSSTSIVGRSYPEDSGGEERARS